jgi:hypothetical protein
LPSSLGGPASQAKGISTATRALVCATPSLPDRSQFDRSVRRYVDLIEEMALHLADV